MYFMMNLQCLCSNDIPAVNHILTVSCNTCINELEQKMKDHLEVLKVDKNNWAKTTEVIVLCLKLSGAGNSTDLCGQTTCQGGAYLAYI